MDLPNVKILKHQGKKKELAVVISRAGIKSVL